MKGPAHEGYKLFVGDLPQDITDEELRMVFSTYGEVLGVHVLPMNSKSNHRCSLVFYKDQQSAEDAISVLSGIYRIRQGADQPIKVSWARDRAGGPPGTVSTGPVSPAPHAAVGFVGSSDFGGAAPYGSHAAPAGGAASPQYDPDGFKLFIGGLPSDCTAEELTMVFSTYGEVNKVHVMPPHREHGRVAGFVYYKTQQAGEDAISVLDGKYKIRVDAEQPILVKWAQPKDKGAGKGDKGAPTFDHWGSGGGAGQGQWAGGGGQGGPAPPTSPGWGSGEPPQQKFQTPEGWKIFAGGLPLDISEGELQTVFSTYGQVVKLHIMPANAQGHVAAFIYYASEQSAEDAIKVLNKVYKIRVDAAEPIQVKWANAPGSKGEKGEGGKGKGKGDKGWQQDWSAGGAGGGESWGSSGGSWGGGDSYSKGGKGKWGEQGQSWSGGGGGGGAPPLAGGGGGKGGQHSDSKVFVGNLPDDITDEALKYVFGTYGQVQQVHIMHGKSKSGNSCAFVEFMTPSEAETAILTLNDKYEIKQGYGKIMVKKANSQGGPGGPRKGPY